MIFLIQYDRRKGCIISMDSFRDSERKDAQDALLALELRLNRNGDDKEVVLLEAESEDVIRKTHRRYFESLRELTSAPAH
jgi:hypothetical protein